MSTFPWGLLLLVVAVVAIVWIVRGRKPAPPPAAGYEPTPMATGWGRQPPQQPMQSNQPMQSPQAAQPGMGGQVMGGLATGLAIGAGALAAQEIGRHMLGGDRSQHGLGSVGETHAGGSASDSSLARDAGTGSIGRGDNASWDAGSSASDHTAVWDDGGGAFGGDDGGGGGSDT